ncbi:MAG: glycerophosphodiester phosphodiesterase [Planctomycetes bacterium]|nr:glycerophosphodiester phosphodiesterase [Planctomycetota bacterium]
MIRTTLLSLILFSTALLSSARAAERETQTPAEKLTTSRRVLIIAHRGDSKAAPENTLPAFRSALQAGADLVELDYYHSSDGVPVVFHDKELDRTTDAVRRWGGEKIPLTSKSLAELRKLDAGSWFDAKFAGTRIPTLARSIEVIQAGSVTLVERKGGDAKTCVALLEKHRWTERLVVQAFDWDYLADCHRLAPKLVLGALGSKEITAARLDQIENCGASVVGWNYQDLRKSDVVEIHRRGLRVWVYTVDDLKVAQRLIDLGVDGLITNVPGKMRKLVAP